VESLYNIVESLVDDYDDGDHNKTVYAHFGLAVYLAQCLEHEIANCLVSLDLIPNTAHLVRSKVEWESSCDAFFDGHFKHTLGRMIDDLRRVATVPAQLEVKLASALQSRNWLAHSFFRERSDDFMTRAGRDRMIAELEAAQEVIRDADRSLHSTFKPVRERYGFTDVR